MDVNKDFSFVFIVCPTVEEVLMSSFRVGIRKNVYEGF